MNTPYTLIPSEPAEALLESVLAFRTTSQSCAKPDDVKALLDLFPRVAVRDGYVLDYLQESTRDGVLLPIHPYARPADDDSWIPLSGPSDEVDRGATVEELYDYLEYEATPEGLFEYALFAIELHSHRAGGYAAEWQDSTPIFTETRFDATVEQAGKVSDLKRPEHFGPQARREDEDGGRARFLVYTQMGWERIYYLDCRVYGDGFVEHEAGDILADMGTGLIF